MSKTTLTKRVEELEKKMQIVHMALIDLDKQHKAHLNNTSGYPYTPPRDPKFPPKIEYAEAMVERVDRHEVR